VDYEYGSFSPSRCVGALLFQLLHRSRVAELLHLFTGGFANVLDLRLALGQAHCVVGGNLEIQIANGVSCFGVTGAGIAVSLCGVDSVQKTRKRLKL